MMRYHIILLAGLFALTACGISPEPDYYTLMPEAPTKQGSTDKEQPALNQALTIKVRRPTIASYLDRPDFVTQDSAYQVRIDEMTRWAEPLDRMSERVFAEDLRQRLPASLIVTEASLVNSDVRFTIDIDMQQFNAIEAGHVTLRGTMIITDKGAQGYSAPFILSTESGLSPDDVASALSKLLGELADKAQSQLAVLAAAQK